MPLARVPDGPGPERTCIATRQVLPVERLIRFVAAPDGTVVPDLRHRLPGRGVWVSARAAAVAEAVRRKAFSRTLKVAVTAPADLAVQVEALMHREALQALALANKAGGVIAGAAKVEGGARRGYVALFHAAEASEDGVRKVERAVRSAAREGWSAPSIRHFSGEELSLSLGRQHVIHAALVAGGPAGLVLDRVRALQDFRRPEAAEPSVPEPGVPERGGMFVLTRDSDPDE